MLAKFRSSTSVRMYMFHKLERRRPPLVRVLSK
jgi:hypothetical protein